MEEPRIINLPKIIDRRGNLSFAQEEEHVPFKIARTYWIYDVPGGERRGGHAYKENREFIVALSGSFDVILHDGSAPRIYHLNRSYYGLFVPNCWLREMGNFSTNSVGMVFASMPYTPSDYNRDFEDFVRGKK